MGIICMDTCAPGSFYSSLHPESAAAAAAVNPVSDPEILSRCPVDMSSSGHAKNHKMQSGNSQP